MVALDDQIPDAPPALTSVLMLDQGLEPLEAISPQRRQAVGLRYFAGKEFSEIAAALEVSERTVYRERERARAFLQAMPDAAGGDARHDADGQLRRHCTAPPPDTGRMMMAHDKNRGQAEGE